MSGGASLFDRQAASYAEFRPSYPKELYEIIFKFCDFSEKPEQALDVATGSGQAAVVLAEYFQRVSRTEYYKVIHACTKYWPSDLRADWPSLISQTLF